MGALVYFSNYERAADATLLGLDLQPSAIEILDESYMSLVKGTSPEFDSIIHPDAKAMLYFEFEGESQEELLKSVFQLNRIVSLSQPLKFMPLTTEEEILRLWRLREEASKIMNFVKSKGKTSFVEDVAVPLPRLPEYMKGLGNILSSYGIDFSIYGHAGTGNVHCAAFVDLKNPDHYKAVDSIASEVYDLAISLGGTLSGEHGDGFIRTPFLERLYGPEIYDLFRTVKKTFDPNNILNPEKIIGRQNVSILHDLAL
jgi:FAD/FMN-containing dehydrogenase